MAYEEKISYTMEVLEDGQIQVRRIDNYQNMIGGDGGQGYFYGCIKFSTS